MPLDSLDLLHSAVLKNNESAVRFLLKYGADANARASVRAKNDTDNELDSQSVNPSSQMCEVFSSCRSSTFGAGCSFAPNPEAMAPGPSYTFSKRDRVKQHQQRHTQHKTLTPMHVAAATGHETILELLIGHGGEIDATMEGNYTPLAVAVIYKRYEIVKLLVNKGANVNARSPFGKTPMYYAVKTKHPGIISLLLEKGADPNLATDNGVTPLHIAVERKLADVTEMLLKYGADVNVKTKTGVTPLHCAAVKGQMDITEMILSYGADVSVIMKKGEIDVMPLIWVTETEKNKIMDVVKKYVPKSRSTGLSGTFFKKIWKRLGLKKCVID